MRFAVRPSLLAAIAVCFAAVRATDLSIPAAVEHEHEDGGCLSRCGATFSSRPSTVCNQICTVLHDHAGETQCRQDLLDSSYEHLTLLSFSSGHILESLAILSGTSGNSTPPQFPEYAAFMGEFHLNDRGSPAACSDIVDSHYCVAQQPLFASIGLCLPTSCGSGWIKGVLANITESNPGLLLADGPGAAADAGAVLGGSSITCGDELRVRPNAWSFAVFSLMASILLLVGLGTAIDYYRCDPKEQPHAKKHQQHHRHGADIIGGDKTNTNGNTNAVAVTSAAAAGRSTTSDALAASASWVTRGGGLEESKDGGLQQHAAEEENEVLLDVAATYSGDPAQEPLLSGAEREAAAAEAEEQEQLLAEEGKFDALDESEHVGGGRGVVVDKLRRMRKSNWGRWILDRLQCFSLVINTKSLLAPPRAGDEFRCLEGVRTLSMMWVVLGHCFAYNVTGGGPGFTNTIRVLPQHGEGFMARMSAQVIPGGFLAVDTFFLMSGFLLSSVLLPQLDAGTLSDLGRSITGSSGWRGSWMLKAYVHRYLRLTPTLAFATLMFWKVVPLLGSGAGWWPVAAAQEESCRRYWWTEVTYTQAFLPWPPLSDGCTGVSWYLSDDTLYFLAGVPLLALYHRAPRVGATIAAVVAVVSTLFTLVWYGFHDNISFTVFARVVKPDGWGIVYAAPWTRCPTYLVGALCGMVWHSKFRGRVGNNNGVVSTTAGGGSRIGAAGKGGSTHGASSHGSGANRITDRRSDAGSSVAESEGGSAANLKNPLNPSGRPGPMVSWPAVLVGVMATTLLAVPVYGTYWSYQDALDPGLSPWADHLYMALSRPAWSMGVALMCLLCFTGHGGLVNWFLTRPGWTPLSRLTYCAYLFHTMLLTVLYGSRNLAIELTALEFAITYMGVVMGTFLGATALHLLVEAPFRNLESLERRKMLQRLRATGQLKA